MKSSGKSSLKQQPSRSLEARIYAVYSSFTPAEKRLADVLLQYQMELPSYTAGELALKADVSKATAARLIRTLGYKTYPDAKRQIRADQHWGSPRAGLADPDRAPSEKVSIATTVQMDIDNIRTTAEGLSPETLEAVSNAIVKARRVWIMGLRSGYGLAHQAAHYLTLMKNDVQVLPAGGASYSHEIASIARGDVMLVIAFRRRPRLLPTIIKEARAAGAITVLITDLSAAASAKAAEHVLRCRCQSPSPFNSFVAALSIINYLSWSVATAMGEESLKRYEKIDRLVKLLDDVSTPQTNTGR
ncbi:MurR/RpiR family transcriptional regulator [Rhizobium sp. SSA_523]|uniref:MurR/RpiR family transcriptional regulator n=1 Tax=Rhizobium sp. SSA_523 TaxID=2952477 RepID=UPI0020910F78|nr:MurR/RpiR family transcriptional regulator [Rhizobium sp. SSA_523]MCO5733342.1 MurR/RpiR family transcriptional regulator [Rhizobium sp. SSA_523]WKC21680.1 MurR/RpiR family transcriptional regulator [Rhizobium sp. SSA_523]